MMALYVIVGGLVILALGLYILLRVLSNKKQRHEVERRKLETMQAVAESHNQDEQRFIPSSGE